jgi:hypothetical protein
MENLPEGRSADNRVVVDFAMHELVAVLRRAVRTRRRSGESFEKYEEEALRLSNEAVRRLLEAELQERADRLSEELMIEGAEFRRHQPGTVAYHSLCGAVSVRRFTYREVGVRNGPTCVPLEMESGMVERATPALASAVGRGYADRTSRALEEDLRAAARVPPSRSTIERMAVEIGTQAKAAVCKIEPRLRRRERLPKAACALTMGLDRTTVPMLEPRTGTDKFEVKYRMAYVATVCITDRETEALQTRRYAAPAHEGPQQILSRVEADLQHALKQKPQLRIAVVQDGAPELWGLMWELLDRMGIKRRRRVERIDRYHATQHLSGALDALKIPDPIKTKILDRWKELLNRRNTAIYRIGAELEEMSRGLPQTVCRALMQHTTYLSNYDRLRYATLRKMGIPQGSGVTEGACKSLITTRTKRSGQKWSKHGIESVLALRSIVHSDRWPGFWNSFTKSRQVEIELIRA